MTEDEKYAIYGASYNTIMNSLRDNKLDIVDKVAHQYKNDKEFNLFLSETIKKNIQAFKSCIGGSNPINIPKQCAILKHLSFEQQLELMNYDIKAQLPHIEVLINSPDYCKDKLLESWCYHHAMSYHFKQEDFNAISQLNSLLGNQVLANKHNIGYFHGAFKFSDDKLALMARFVYFEENDYTSAYNIVYDYSDAKKNYLLSQNIALPTIEDAQDITKKIIASLKQTGSYDDYDKVYLKSGLEKYKAILLYNELQESLPVMQSKNMRSKI